MSLIFIVICVYCLMVYLLIRVVYDVVLYVVMIMWLMLRNSLLRLFSLGMIIWLFWMCLWIVLVMVLGCLVIFLVMKFD